MCRCPQCTADAVQESMIGIPVNQMSAIQIWMGEAWYWHGCQRISLDELYAMWLSRN